MTELKGDCSILFKLKDINKEQRKKSVYIKKKKKMLKVLQTD